MAVPDDEEPEPRFAGSVPAGYQPPVAHPMPPSAPSAYSDAFPPAFEPEVSYSGSEPIDEPARQLYLHLWLAPLLAAAGGIVAIVGSVLNWATLRLVSKTLSATPDPQDSEHIAYNGLALLEGRATLVVGVVAVVLSVLQVLRHPLPIGLAVAGAVGLLAALFAAIAHPVDLSTLSRVFGSADDVTVRIPNGVGVWLALIGSALILGGGLVAQLWREPSEPSEPSEPQAEAADQPED
jgi:hypothetical protein